MEQFEKLFKFYALVRDRQAEQAPVDPLRFGHDQMSLYKELRGKNPYSGFKLDKIGEIEVTDKATGKVTSTWPVESHKQDLVPLQSFPGPSTALATVEDCNGNRLLMMVLQIYSTFKHMLELGLPFSKWDDTLTGEDIMDILVEATGLAKLIADDQQYLGQGHTYAMWLHDATIDLIVWQIRQVGMEAVRERLLNAEHIDPKDLSDNPLPPNAQLYLQRALDKRASDS